MDKFPEDTDVIMRQAGYEKFWMKWFPGEGYAASSLISEREMRFQDADKVRELIKVREENAMQTLENKAKDESK